MNRSIKTIYQSPLFWFFVLVIGISVLSLFGPEEKSLGANVRTVYLHGALVLSAELTFIAAGLAGLAGLVTRRRAFHRWSGALGRTGIIFWIIYLPVSLWAMQANWNGLFLAEPRFRLASIFAVSGVLMQVGLALLNKPSLTSAANLVFIIVLRIAVSQTSYIMHPPPSPIFSSGLVDIQVFFIGLNILTLLAAYALTLFWLERCALDELNPD